MRRIGTLSSAIGLIFIGIWMIISKVDYKLGQEIFKWWPSIIILLGVEILLTMSRKLEHAKPSLNLLIIPVIILFMGINAYQSIAAKFNGWNFSNFKNFAQSMEDSNYKRIQGEKILPLYGNTIAFNINNPSINIKKSMDGKIKIHSEVFVDKNAPINKYTIAEVKEVNGYRIDMNQVYVKKVNTEVYIPDGYNLNIDGDNLDFEQQDALDKTKFNIKSDNASLDVKNALDINFNGNNSDIKLENVKSVKISGDNASANLRGNIENMILDTDNADLDIKNNLCKNVDIKSENGNINFRTDDKNIDAQIYVNDGTCNFNGEEFENRIVSKKMGNGSGKIKIRVNRGSIDFSNN